MTEKLQQVKQLLNRITNLQQSQAAEGSLGQAEGLMREIEAELLANPFLQDEDLESLVRFNRGSMWASARRHVENLRRCA